MPSTDGSAWIAFGAASVAFHKKTLHINALHMLLIIVQAKSLPGNSVLMRQKCAQVRPTGSF